MGQASIAHKGELAWGSSSRGEEGEGGYVKECERGGGGHLRGEGGAVPAASLNRLSRTQSPLKSMQGSEPN